VYRRLLIVCQLWPSISPHGPEVPTSIWNLPYGVWLAIAAETDAALEAQKKQK
jgi:hypothetical protein